MNISKFMRPDLIFLDVDGRDKTEVIEKIVKGMAARQVVSKPEQFLQEVLSREAQSPTCIGRGIALPHSRTNCVDQHVIAFARTLAPIQFTTNADDDVKLIFLLGTPLNDNNTYLRILANLCRQLRQHALRRALLSAVSADEILTILSAEPAENVTLH